MKRFFLILAALIMPLCFFGCMSSGSSAVSSKAAGRFQKEPGFYTVWTERPQGPGNIVIWAGKKDPRGGAITIGKIYANNKPGEEGAVVILDFSENPFAPPEEEFWWAQFDTHVSGGRYSLSSSVGEIWGGGFSWKHLSEYSYIGFSVLLSRGAIARMGDALVEIDNEAVMFADMIKPLLEAE